MAERKGTMRRWRWALISCGVLPIHVWFVFESFWELFVSVPGVHYSRVTMEEVNWGWTRVEFVTNTPTIGNFLVLVGGLIAIAGVLGTVVRTARRRDGTPLFWLIVQALGFSLAFVAMLIVIDDFFSSAGQFG
jgi:hypothetical protein